MTSRAPVPAQGSREAIVEFCIGVHRLDDMLNLARHPRLVKALSLWDRIAARALTPSGANAPAAEPDMDGFYERAWRDAASSLGAKIESLGSGILEISLGTFRCHVLQNTSPIDDLMTHLLVRTKPVVARLLGEQGIPMPEQLTFSPAALDAAAAAFVARHGVCAVKPAEGTGGGAGVTTGVRDAWSLARAAALAGRFGPQVIVERQVAGHNYRLLYLDGELLDVVRRDPPTVTGDGVARVIDLVRAANARRARGGWTVAHAPLTIDLDMRHTLSRQGLSPRSVPSPGRVVVLKTAINQNGAAENIASAAAVCPSIVRDGARAARACGARLAGVDIITPDPSLPLAEGGGVVLEVNVPPGFYWHYCQREGPGVPVARHVLRRLMIDAGIGPDDAVPTQPGAAAVACG